MNITPSSHNNNSIQQQNIEPRYFNAVPVVVMLVPIQGIDPETGQLSIGVLAIRRAIEPRLGQLALPGGYLEYEDWRAAGIREVFQETGIIVGEPGDVTICEVESVEQGKRLLIFAKTPPLSETKLAEFIPNDETSERLILYKPTDLAFPSHTQALRHFLEELHSGEANPSKGGDRDCTKSPSTINLAEEKITTTLKSAEVSIEETDSVELLLDQHLPNVSDFEEFTLSETPLTFVQRLGSIIDSCDTKMYCLDARNAESSTVQNWLTTFATIYAAYQGFIHFNDRFRYFINPLLLVLATPEQEQALNQTLGNFNAKIIVPDETSNLEQTTAAIVVENLRKTLRFLFDPKLVVIPKDARLLNAEE